MARAWSRSAEQWVRWLMGEAPRPGKGQRSVLLPMVLVLGLSVVGLTAVIGFVAPSSAPVGVDAVSGPPTPPPGFADSPYGSPDLGGSSDASGGSDSSASSGSSGSSASSGSSGSSTTSGSSSSSGRSGPSGAAGRSGRASTSPAARATRTAGTRVTHPRVVVVRTRTGRRGAGGTTTSRTGVTRTPTAGQTSGNV